MKKLLAILSIPVIGMSCDASSTPKTTSLSKDIDKPCKIILCQKKVDEILEAEDNLLLIKLQE